MGVLFATVVDASDAVAATRKRSEKTAILASLLSQVSPAEAAICVGLLSGEPRQGRIGVGWATVRDLEATSADQATMTVADVDDAISAIAVATGPGSAGHRRALLADLMARATAAERSFLTALLTGELRQGALAGVMGDAVARAAGVSPAVTRRALMLSGDLSRTAEIAIAEGEAGLLAVGLEVMRPVLPMLASASASVAEAVSTFRCASVEHKLDGLRVQIHRRGDEVRVFSRNLNDLTARLPGIVAAVRSLPVDEVVLDGEALWMGADGPASFQETMSQIDTDAPPEGVVTFLFDVLHVDGVDLLDSPQHERSAWLRQIAPELMVPAVVTDVVAVAEQVLQDAVAAGHEGVVIKDVDSTYAAGRRGAAWRKVKPVRTFDLVVLGAEWGHGRRHGRLSNLHLGARDPDTGGFVMVGKTFKGLTDELLAWQTEALLTRETGREGIAVLVAPELVIEIAIDGVQSSTRYRGGVALRFARVKRYRPDKQPAQADTIDALRALLPGGERTQVHRRLRPPNREGRTRASQQIDAITIESWLSDSEESSLANDVLEGLTRPFKELPPKHFYDSRGSELFEQICELPEYYTTRAETAILNEAAAEIVALTGAGELVELGSGAAHKARVLLGAMAAAGTLRRYVPFDVSESVLNSAAEQLVRDYDGLRIHGIIGDFERHLPRVPERDGAPRLVALLGGTIGNLAPEPRRTLLRGIASLLDVGDHVLLGTDLVKDVAVIEAAYNDSLGVTAEFNRNVLHVINRELDGNFDVDAFEHVAFFDRDQEWIEMRLRARRAMTVRVNAIALDVTFAEGEELRTEISAKFTIERVRADLAAAGLTLERWLTDDQGRFALSVATRAR